MDIGGTSPCAFPGNFIGGCTLSKRVNRFQSLICNTASVSGILFFSLCTLLLVLLTGKPLYAQQPSPTYDPTQVTAPSTVPMALFGEASYQQNCAPCHGEQGMGDGPTAASLPGPATAFADPAAIQALTPSELFYTTKFGRIQNLMPPWGNRLSDEEIWQTVAYAWSLHTNEDETTAGADLYNGTCTACHGAQGAGDGPDAPVDLVDFTDLDYAITKSQADWQAGWQTAHPELGADWTVDQQAAVLEYLRTFSFTPPWGEAYRAGAGVIAGSVAQGTAGGDGVVGLPVTLEAYAGFNPIAVFTTTVDAAGAYTFTELATDASINYLSSVNSDGIRYSSTILNFTPDTALLSAPITIYGTTDDPAVVHMNSIHWIIDPRPGAVVVVEVYGVGTEGDRTYVGKAVEGVNQPVTVALPVPPAAQDLGFENGVLGERFQQVGDVAYDTAPVLPGQGSRQIIMRYMLPQEGRTLEVTRDFNYAVDDMSLLVAELPDISVEIPGFILASRETFQNQSYQLWRPDGAIPEQLTIRLSGLLAADDVDPRTVQRADVPATDTNGGTAAAVIAVPQLTSWMPWSIVAALLVGLIGLAIWSLQTGKLGTVSSEAARQAQRRAVLKRIAHLDDQHAIGEVNESEWQQQRSRLKVQLLAITTTAE